MKRWNVVLVISALLGGVWACGSRTGIGLVDEIADDGAASSGPLDSAADAAVADATADVPFFGREAGDAGETDAALDSPRDAAVADVAADASSASDADDGGLLLCPAGTPPSGTCSPEGARCSRSRTMGAPDCEICFCQNGVWADCVYCADSRR